MAEQPFVRQDIYEKDLGRFDERLDALQTDMREVKALSAAVLSHDLRLKRLENGEKTQSERNWKLILILLAAVLGARLPELLPWFTKLFK